MCDADAHEMRSTLRPRQDTNAMSARSQYGTNCCWMYPVPPADQDVTHRHGCYTSVRAITVPR